MRKRIRNLFIPLSLLVSLIILISACNSSSNKEGVNESGSGNINQQIFLLGNGPYLKNTIYDIIDKSGIKRGGYVVILPMPSNKPDSSAHTLQKEFYNQQIKAVHILDFDDNFQQDISALSIKNSDVLAIENASVICLLSGRKNKFMSLANNSRLKKALQNAKAKGALIVGAGNGASVLGALYYNQVRDTISNELKILMKRGLGLLKNAIVDDIAFLNDHRKRIRKKITKKNFLFIGMGNKSSVWIKDSEAVVLSKTGIRLMSPDTTVIRLGFGDEFSLLPQ